MKKPEQTEKMEPGSSQMERGRPETTGPEKQLKKELAQVKVVQPCNRDELRINGS